MNHSLKITKMPPRTTANGAHTMVKPYASTNTAAAPTHANGARGQGAACKHRAGHLLAFCIACSTIFFSFATPNPCKAALLVGYETCVNQLLFALFPFLIAANLLVLCGVAPLLGHPLRPLCKLLGFGEDCAAGLLAIALLGGFAPAVSALAQSVQAGQISKARAGKLLPLLCFLGPSYIVLAVGAGMLGSLQTGVCLFASQVLASVCSVLLLRGLDVCRSWAQTTHHPAAPRRGAPMCAPAPHAQSNPTPHNPTAPRRGAPMCAPAPHAQPNHIPHNPTAPRRGAPMCAPAPHAQSNPTPHNPTPLSISAVIGDCFFAFLRLCGVMLYFQFLAAGMCALLPAQYHWLCQMALEVTATCGQIAAMGHAATFRCCAALSVLSGSILLQIAALCPAGVSCKRLLSSRLLHLPLALGFFRLFLLIPQTQTVYSSLNTRVIAMQRLPLDQALLLFLALIFLADRLRKPLQRR